jgi:hypothetical protein
MGRILRRWKTPKPRQSRSISSDRIPHSYWDFRSLSMVAARRDRKWWWFLPEAEHSWCCRACCSQHPDNLAERNHIRSFRRRCSCQQFGPRRYLMVPRSSRMIPYRAQVVEAEEVAEENNNPRSSSGIPDHQPGCQRADSRRTAVQCSDSRRDARHRSDRNTCIRYRSRRWEMLSLADRVWWSRHNTVAVGLLRKCSRCELIPRSIRRRSLEHHTHTGFGRWSSELSTTSKSCPMSTCRIRNMGPESLSSNSSIRCSRYDVAQRLPPVPELDPALVAGTSSCPHNDPQVLGFHRVPESSE